MLTNVYDYILFQVLSFYDTASFGWSWNDAYEGIRVISWFLEGANVRKVARRVTLRLVAHFGEKQHYSEQEVVFAYTETMSNKKYVDFALAMFCSLNEFGDLQQKYAIVRTQSQYHALIGRYCFGGWPRFNTQTLIDYANGKLHTSPSGY